MFTNFITEIVTFISLLLTVSGHFFNDKTNRCFQCEYRPPKIHTVHIPVQERFEYRVPIIKRPCPKERTVSSNQQYRHRYNKLARPFGYRPPPPPSYRYPATPQCVPEVVYELREGYRLKYELRTHSSPAGGYNPCMGPLTGDTGRASGVEDRSCHSACYTRRDSYGNISRGCYKGEYGVDPSKSSPQKVNGQTYRFCNGNYCNGDKV